MTTFKKTFWWEPIFCLNQEEDSEEEPKLKYERLSNGVTEILQKDAASCMTVHDKVKMIIHHLWGHFREMSSSTLVFILSAQPVKAAHSFLTLCFFSSQGGASESTIVFSSFYSHSSAFFSPLCWMLIFLRGLLSAWCLIVVAPAAHLHAWAEQKSHPLTSPHLMFY